MPEIGLVWFGTACFGIGALVLVLPNRGRRPRETTSFLFLLTGVVLLFIAIGERWMRLGQGPFMTMFEVLLSNTFSLGLIYMFFWCKVPITRQCALFILLLLYMLGIWTTSVPPDPVPLPATFDNYLLWFHVLSGKLFLGTCLVATGMAVLLLLNPVVTRFSLETSTTNIVAQDQTIWRLMALAFIFDTCMLIIGAAWAHDAWGRYWTWDPLETWSLMTWLVLGITLHLRITFKLPLWIGWLLVLTVFILAFLTFFGVPFLSLGPHKGIM